MAGPQDRPHDRGEPPGARSSRRDRAGWLSVVGAFVVLRAAWQAVVLVGGLPPYILPPPGMVAERFVERLGGRHGLAALRDDDGRGPARLRRGRRARRWWSATGWPGARSFERLASPYLVAAQAIPILALAPLLVLWFGPGLGSKVVICALIVFFPVAIATMVGIRSVDARLLELGRSLRATRRQVLTTLEIPAALPSIFGGMRVGVTLAVVGAIVGEWAGASKGLAVLINLARGSLFDIPLMFATLLTIALVGVALYLVVVLVERRLVGAR